ncbi:DUF2971 domain-containing protein [Tenacibaculum aiptasiae]|uniref:DUF2971 domain-containing protein n=1 Tax=Tenacibaculum aiptasiae TaxID=426481 RepID=UPI00232AB2C6|nr:DUF2971 domain-containing protein [Tenacibaculum aiptasiae]
MYKFYSVSNSGIVENIIGKKSSIKFDSAFNFNDPFELKFNLNLGNPNDLRHKEFYFKTNPNDSENDYMRWVKNSKRQLWSVEQDLRGYCGKNYKIACFSNVNNSNLMWSHYANNYRGFCVEYSDELFEFFKKKINFVASKDVSYSSVPPEIKILGDKVNQAKGIFFNKQKEWEYEKEHRLILKGSNETEFIDINPQFIKRIFIGSKCNLSIRKKIIDISKSYSFKIYQAITVGKTYEITFKEYKANEFPTKSFW